MKSGRRNFLKSSLLGTSILASGFTRASNIFTPESETKGEYKSFPKMEFNMCGYAAPKLDKVRIGFIGLGARGSGFGGHGTGAVGRYTFIEGVEITALCDQYEDRVEAAQQTVLKKGLPRAKGYSGSKEAWKFLCESPDIDLVYICTPWAWHAQMANYAMECGKHVAVEVPAGVTIDECWQLVETSERTRKHCMMLENCCYDFFELLTLNLARIGFFGEIIHGEGSYIHYNLPGYIDKNYYAEMWRLNEETRNGNIYPTHGLGPICQIMDINRGDRMKYMVSMQSDDFIMSHIISDLAEKDSFFKEYEDKSFRGNINTTLIRTVKGKTIMSQHDVAIPRPYSRAHLLAGTKATAMKWPLPPRIATEKNHHHWLNDEEMKEIEEKYTPKIVREVGDLAKKVGGHGGMDFIMDWKLIYCLRNGLPLDMDVYDAASWSSVAPLSEISVANRSVPLEIPDFTRGAWKTNLQLNLNIGDK